MGKKLTKAQVRALRWLSGDKSVGALNPSTANAMLWRLHDLGLFDMDKSYTLTPAGRTALQEQNHGG